MKKSSKNKIARVYSTALYEAAVERKCVDEVWKDIEKLQILLRENTEITSYLSSPLWSEQDKDDVLKKTANVLKLNKETVNCLEVVTENNRAADLSAILDDFIKVYYQKNDIAEVEVETVKNLSAEQDRNLKKILEKLFAKKVVINYQVNPTVLGGLRVKYGSEMFDDSLAVKLNYLENVMKGK